MAKRLIRFEAPKRRHSLLCLTELPVEPSELVDKIEGANEASKAPGIPGTVVKNDKSD